MSKLYREKLDKLPLWSIYQFDNALYYWIAEGRTGWLKGFSPSGQFDSEIDIIGLESDYILTEEQAKKHYSYNRIIKGMSQYGKII